MANLSHRMFIHSILLYMYECLFTFEALESQSYVFRIIF